jgi:hypothetical protein
MIAQKIKHGWGYDVGPFPPSVVLSHDGTNYQIEHWPNANPPTIAEIEAIELPSPVTLRHIAPYDFIARFTDAELVSIQTSVDPLVIRGRTKLQTIITHVDLDAVETQMLIGYLAMTGVITQERAAEILA